MASRNRGLTASILELALVFGLVPTVSTAQTYTDLHHFDCSTEGCNPRFPAQLAQGRDGNLYGMMPKGGMFNLGTFFKVTTHGTVSVPYMFDGNDGNGFTPRSGLTLGTDGLFYGTTLKGGQSAGTIVKIRPSGTIDTLYRFRGQEGTTCTASDEPDGGDPYAPPVQGTGGYYYGITSLGTSYRISSSGDFKVLCSLVSPSVPIPLGALSPVVQATDGYFYGTSSSESGAIFRFSPAGVAKIVHTFIPSEGSTPNGPVLQASDGNLYGTTASGGPLGSGSGVIYKLTLGGKLTVTHAFDRVRKFAEGYRANAGLLEATDGLLYGSTQYGGDPGCGPGGNGCGVLFRITKSGNYTVLHTFHSAEPAHPQATQIQHTNGKIYGLLNGPNFSDGGAIYSLDVGLKPFVRLMTRSGKAGQKVQLLGQSLAGATRVKFGTGSASFEVVSDKFLTALVPVAGTTGSVTVTTPSGTLTSSISFKVIPTLTGFDPLSGPVGTQVVINGTGLTQTSKVTFGGVPATFSVTSALRTQVMATVPPGAITGKITITTPGGVAASSRVFTLFTGFCTKEGAQCADIFPPCCPGLTCRSATLRHYCFRT